MTYGIRVLLLAAAVGALAAAPASAWKGLLESQVIPIARAQDHAASGDRFVIEGIVINSKDGRIFLVRDDSGEMYVVIPDFLKREHGIPGKHERIRVAGRYDHKHLEPAITGMRVQDMERLGRAGATQGSAPSGTAEAAPAPTRAATDPAAPAPNASAHAPSTPEEWKNRLSGARQELLAAEKELDAANAAYARELRDAQAPADVDPAVTANLERVEARVLRARQALPGLVEEARSAGVSPELLDLYVRASQPKR
jgi:uncharacterized protein YdeI (BOF family)